MSNTIKKSIQLTGFAGKDVILTPCINGNKKAILILATSSYQKDGNNRQTKKTEWHKIIAWGRLAEDMAAAVKKGSRLKVTCQAPTGVQNELHGNIKKNTETVLVDFIKLPTVSAIHRSSTLF